MLKLCELKVKIFKKSLKYHFFLIHGFIHLFTLLSTYPSVQMTYRHSYSHYVDNFIHIIPLFF